MQSLAGTARVKTTGERLGGKGTPALGALPLIARNCAETAPRSVRGTEDAAAGRVAGGR